MLGRTVFRVATQARAFSSTVATNYKVAVLGAAGGIGQPLSLLLKEFDNVTQLALYDIVNTPGVAADLSHINTGAKVTGHKGAEELGNALKGSDVVVIPAGVPRKPGMTRDDLFNTNASIVATLIDGVAKNCPKANILIISNPVNSTVPIAAEILKRHNVYDPAKLFGVTTLDICRANTFLAEAQGWNPKTTDVTVVGGHAGITILPLFSQMKGITLSPEQLDKLTVRVQFGGDEVVKAKDGAGSATLSMAYAGARFVRSVLAGMEGKEVSECAFVQSPVVPEVPFFSTRIALGKNGVKQINPIGKISEYEQGWLNKMIPELKSSIDKGVAFAKAWQPK